LQSIAIALWIRPYVFNWNLNFITDCTITLTTGSIIIMWLLSEVITEYGIGNGASLLIFQNIISGIPKNIHIQNIISGIPKNIHNYTYLFKQNKIIPIFIISILFICMLSITILIQEGTKKISIISAKQ